MANETIMKIHPDAPAILIGDVDTDFSTLAPATAANNIGIPANVTSVQMDMTSLAASGGARESDKFDFGANRAPMYRVDMVAEFAVAPADGDTVAHYLAGSNNATAGSGNPANLTGVDAAYTETDGLLAQLQAVGSLVCDNAAVVVGYVGIVVPHHRYGIWVVENEAGQAFNGAAGMDETYILLTPLTYGT